MKKKHIKSYKKPIRRKRKYPYKYGKKSKYSGYLVYFTALILLILLLLLLYNFFTRDKKATLSINTEAVAAFNIPYSTFSALEDLSVKYGLNFYELLTYYSLENKFFVSDINIASAEQIEQSFIINYDTIKAKYKEKDILPYYNLFETVLSEIKYFPIPVEYKESEDYVYSNSWGAVRTYGKEHSHEGTDIMDRENIRGRIPVISMTNGTIEDIGWNEYGGFRIGIRSSSGTYYYYAHFDSFAENLTKGSVIAAGDFLGYMGDSGYSKKEGTKGNFAVHLHIGIQPEANFAKNDFWMNPYVFLRYAEEKN